ncbi:cytochrome P450 [Aspergillus ibericus CBS 121593]|uniref:Cytochrome P450 n=1 Tax=Aspergillus ibericus CBS 121593 TaxID=1448316 RepID=A0A395H1X4_9EURO|nr:cytochrome P450 [Aspergillus ibericus CBS 121593]RAL01215.1 cytochrome P450 [Aspergillus ibericus CBS 121593]
MTSVSFDADFDTLRTPPASPSRPARNFVRFIRGLLGKRLKGAGSGSDIFSFLQQCKDPDTGEGLTLPELSTETATFIVAGSDTTSTTMAAVCHYLTGSPRCYRRVAEETGSGSPGAARLEEASTAFTTGRPTGRIRFTFDPDRWLAAAADAPGRPYMPFSIGARSCIGKPLALAQVMLTITRLLWAFNLRRAEGPAVDAEYVVADHVTAGGKGPWLCFRPR